MTAVSISESLAPDDVWVRTQSLSDTNLLGFTFLYLVSLPQLHISSRQWHHWHDIRVSYQHCWCANSATRHTSQLLQSSTLNVSCGCVCVSGGCRYCKPSEKDGASAFSADGACLQGAVVRTRVLPADGTVLVREAEPTTWFCQNTEYTQNVQYSKVTHLFMFSKWIITLTLQPNKPSSWPLYCECALDPVNCYSHAAISAWCNACVALCWATAQGQRRVLSRPAVVCNALCVLQDELNTEAGLRHGFDMVYCVGSITFSMSTYNCVL